MDRDELKVTFHRVAAYRQICDVVRGTANATLFHGFIFAAFAMLLYRIAGPGSIMFLICTGVAIIEFAVGFWKKLRPSIECILVDAINSTVFGSSLVARFALAHFGVIPRNPDVISLVLGIWILFSAWSQFRNYLLLLRMFPFRPTREQMAYVDEMISELKLVNPETDPTSLDLPGPPRVRALLADEIAFVMFDASSEATVLDREHLGLEREEGVGGYPAMGRLVIGGQRFAPFPLSDANWRNYLRWKGESAE